MQLTVPTGGAFQFEKSMKNSINKGVSKDTPLF